MEAREAFLKDIEAIGISHRLVLSRKRRAERLGNASQPMPARIDAALHILVADGLLGRGDRQEGLAELALAVETVPGLADLVHYEEAITHGEDPLLDLRKFILCEEEFVVWDKSEAVAAASDHTPVEETPEP